MSYWTPFYLERLRCKGELKTMINFLEEDKKENMLQNGILAKFNGITILELPTLTDKSKYIKLSKGDTFVFNAKAIQEQWGINIKKLKVGATLPFDCICTKKIKGYRRWWQFWRPRYWGAQFMYLGKENM